MSHHFEHSVEHRGGKHMRKVRSYRLNLYPRSVHVVYKTNGIFGFDFDKTIDILLVFAALSFTDDKFEPVEITVNDIQHFVYPFINVNVHVFILRFGR